MEQIFEFLIFFGNMAGYVQNFGHFANFVHNFGHISKKKKNQKSVTTFFRYYIEVPLVQISAS